MRERKGQGRERIGWRCFTLVLIPLTLVATDLPSLAPTQAQAQEGPFGFVGRIFGGSRERRYIDEPPPNYSPRPKYYIDPPVEPQRRPADRQRPPPRKTTPASDDAARASGSAASAAGTASAAVRPAPPKPVEKAADAKVILVVGDFMALSLAKGLDATVADKANIRIADRTDGSSGLVRDDHFDWRDRIGAIIEDEKPAAVLVMLGTNDRQAIRTGGEALELRSEAWTDEYKARIAAFAKTIGERKLPLIWVGLPALKSTSANDDIAYFNELYRQAAVESGGEFVDVWDGFVDEDGAFASTGPDIAGQPARLRNSDGITMTPQGARKLAFFAEKPLEKLFGTGFENTAPVQADIAKATPQNPANATAVPALAMNSPSLDGGEALLGGSAAPIVYPAQPSPREKLVLSGAPLPSHAGRADNFAWNAKAGPVGPIGPDNGAPPVGSSGASTPAPDGLRFDPTTPSAKADDPASAPLR